MKNNHIPSKNIMIIAPDLDLIRQLKKHVEIYNDSTKNDIKIHFQPLKNYEKNALYTLNPLLPNYITVYYTIGTHISDTDKNVTFDYKKYIDKNGWYLILDEAHKGDFAESKRKQSLNILAKNGIIFNFSATFTDEIDKISTIFDFKLNQFIQAGYGKNIKVLDEEYRNFRAVKGINAEFNDEDKENIILKSFVIYSLVKKKRHEILAFSDQYGLDLYYHNPLMITISNEINTSNADMKLYFKCLANLAKGITKERLELVKRQLANNLKQNLSYALGNDKLSETLIKEVEQITYKDILKEVYNSNESGEIEVVEIGGNNDELAFRLKTSLEFEPFGIIKEEKYIVRVYIY